MGTQLDVHSIREELVAQRRRADAAVDQARALALLVREIMETFHDANRHTRRWQECTEPICLAVRMKATAIGYPGMDT